MVKKLFALSLLLLSSQTFAAKGAVIVLEAPYFEKEDLNSRIVQYVRKGDVLFIHDKHVTFNNDSSFYQVIDKSGQVAFVQKKFIKMIYKDEREYAENISPFEHDPTDYRLKEPLPPKYPQLTEERYRGIATFAFGPSPKVNYPYTQQILKENFSPRKGLQISYLKNAEYDTINRFYFGADFHFWQGDATLILDNEMVAKEENGQFSLGPQVTYDAYRDDDYRLVFTGGLSFNLNRTVINLKGNQEEENRIFKAYNITPQIGTLLQLAHVIPTVDVVFGSNLQFHLPYSLVPNSTPTNEDSWNTESDRINHSLGGVFTVFLGIQNIY